MVRMNPDDVQKQVNQQNDDVYGDTATDGGKPVDIDKEYEETMGNGPDEEGVDIAKEVDDDEEAILKDKKEDDDLEDSDEDLSSEEKRLQESGMHIVGGDEDDNTEEVA